MDLKFLEKEGRKVRFVLKGVTPAIANSLRRAMVSLVPTLAIEDVLIEKNESALYNEILAHRLGLVPLKTDLEVYEPREECECEGEGCETCEVRFKLQEEGPGMVKAKDIKPVTDKKIKPVYPEMPIVKLREDQEVKMELIAVMNNAKEHAKWSPCFASYKYYPVLEPNGCSCQEVVEACPRGILKKEEGKVKVKEGKILECNLCEACQDACEEGKFKVKGNKNRLVFDLESWGQLKIPEIIKKACDILNQRLEELDKELKF